MTEPVTLQPMTQVMDGVNVVNGIYPTAPPEPQVVASQPLMSNETIADEIKRQQEEKRRARNNDYCCYACADTSDSDPICCYLFCRYFCHWLGYCCEGCYGCTESCCEGCGNCLNSCCCEDGGCCGDGCCEGGDAGDGCDCGDCGDCDCSGCCDF